MVNSTNSFWRLGFVEIAVDDTIEDKAAIEFARGFYDGLAAGKTVEEAFEEGRSGAALKGADPSQIRLVRRSAKPGAI